MGWTFKRDKIVNALLHILTMLGLFWVCRDVVIDHGVDVWDIIWLLIFAWWAANPPTIEIDNEKSNKT